jgi:hypothetical protein
VTRDGSTLTVDDLSFAVGGDGRVAGFWGPNDAGKSPTIRLIVGLEAPSPGDITETDVSIASGSFPLHCHVRAVAAFQWHPGDIETARELLANTQPAAAPTGTRTSKGAPPEHFKTSTERSSICSGNVPISRRRGPKPRHRCADRGYPSPARV